MYASVSCLSLPRRYWLPITPFSFLKSVNFHKFLEIEVNWFPVGFTPVWDSEISLGFSQTFLLFTSIYCRRSREKKWFHAFTKGICAKVKAWTEPKICSQLAAFNLQTDVHYTTSTSLEGITRIKIIPISFSTNSCFINWYFNCSVIILDLFQS